MRGGHIIGVEALPGISDQEAVKKPRSDPKVDMPNTDKWRLRN
jgi:hypothetical protein